jgi:CRISPR system Cascade subunit CasB
MQTKTKLGDTTTEFLQTLSKQLGLHENSQGEDKRKGLEDRASIATLKRALTGEPRHIRSTYPIILDHLHGVKYHRDEWILVACLYAYYPQKLDFEKPRNFGHSVRGLATATDSDGADRRFRALLDTALEDIRSPLTSMIRLMKSKNIAIDYSKLIIDLSRWGSPEQYVQDDWAKAFWGVPPSDSDKPEEEKDDVNE